MIPHPDRNVLWMRRYIKITRRGVCVVTLFVTESVIEVNPTWAAERIS